VEKSKHKIIAIIKHLPQRYRCMGALVLLVFFSTLAGQTQPTYKELGFPSSATITHDGHGKSYEVVQGKNKILYVANYAGILQIDGTSSELIYTTSQSAVYCLFVSKKGNIYVGGEKQFGTLKSDASGKLSYHKLAVENKDFDRIIEILETPDHKILLVAPKYIFTYDENENKIKTDTLNFYAKKAFSSAEKLYLLDEKDNLYKFSDDKMQRLHSSGLKGIADITAIFPFSEGKDLAVSPSQGLLLIDTTVVKWKYADKQVIKGKLQIGTQIDDQRFAVMSDKKKLYIIRKPDGKLEKIIDIDPLFEDDEMVVSMISDHQGTLWFAFDNGAVKYSMITNPLYTFTPRNNFTSSKKIGIVRDIIKYDEIYYYATSQGVFQLEKGEKIKLSPIDVSCWDINVANNALWAATSKGVRKFEDGKLTSINDKFSLAVFSPSQQQDTLLIGLDNGNLETINMTTGDSTRSSSLKGERKNFEIRRMVEGERCLWVETYSNGVFQLFPTAPPRVFDDNSEKEFLPLGNKLLSTSQGIVMYNQKGTFLFDGSKFSPYNLFKTDSLNEYWFEKIQPDDFGNYWAINGNGRGLVKYEPQGTQDSFRLVDTPFLALQEIPLYAIYPDGDDYLWVGSENTVYQYDLKADNKPAPYPTFIKRILINGGTIIFEGHMEGKAKDSEEKAGFSDLKGMSSILFEFGAANFSTGKKLEYQYRLKGFDDNILERLIYWSDDSTDWSAWTTINIKEYTNLSPRRDYIFEVQAKNINNQIGKVAEFRFHIPPPWYSSWWAFLTYLVLLVGLIVQVEKWRTNKILVERQKLEKIVTVRTEEISGQKKELEKQSEELSLNNDQLEKIDTVVQSINEEIQFSQLFTTLLSKLSVIRNMDAASALTYDKKTEQFIYKALLGRKQDPATLPPLSINQVKERYLNNAKEVFKDIYVKEKGFHFQALGNEIDQIPTPKSMITFLVVEEGVPMGVVTLENKMRDNAFNDQDYSMVGRLKSHLVSAFIKNSILVNLDGTLTDLKNTQSELIEKEKFASIGQLTTGIVDRLLNPMNYIQNFSEISQSLITEAKVYFEQDSDNIPIEIKEDMNDILNDIENNMRIINDHSNSSTRIVKGMEKLLKKRANIFVDVDLADFLRIQVEMAFAEIEDKYETLKTKINYEVTTQTGVAHILQYEFNDVIKSLISNSYYSMREKVKNSPDNTYQPTFTVGLEKIDDKLVITLKDNGKGIPSKEQEMLFRPFHTTKPTSAGTGLGLFMSKKSIQLNKGDITIESVEHEYTKVTIYLLAATASKEA
jgi:signal transduction histidine kinase